VQLNRFAVALRWSTTRRTNSHIIGLICKIIMLIARHDVETAKTHLNAFNRVQSKRVKPY
jgi:hypothetical protein